MRRSRILAAAAIAASIAVSAPTAALATVSDTVNPNCFGKGASQIARGQFEGIEGMGQHASSPDSPRIGIGNLVSALGLDEAMGFVHQSEVADLLGADC